MTPMDDGADEAKADGASPKSDEAKQYDQDKIGATKSISNVVRKKTLLSEIGGFRALSQLIDQWYQKLYDENIRIDDALMESIIELQKATLENVLLNCPVDETNGEIQNKNKGNEDIHTVHRQNAVHLTEDQMHHATDLFREVVKNLKLKPNLEQKLKDVICPSGWIRLGDPAFNEDTPLKLSASNVKLMQTNLTAFVKQAGNENIAGNMLTEAIWGLGDIRKFFKMPARVFSFRFFSQLQRLIKLAGNHEQLQKELFIIGSRHVGYVTNRVAREWMELLLEGVMRLIAGTIDDVWTYNSKLAWQKFLGYCGCIVYVHMNESAENVRLVIKSWNMMAKQTSSAEEKNGKKKSKKEKGSKEGENGDATEGDENQAAGATQVIRSKEVRVTFGQSFFFNVEVMGVKLSERHTREKDELAFMFGDFISKLILNICEIEQIEEEIYMLSLRHLTYLLPGDLTHIPVFTGAIIVTLRSLLPRDWNKEYEHAWNWVWERTVVMFKLACENASHSQDKIDLTMSTLDKHDMDDLCLKFCNKWINADEVNGYFDKPSGIFKFILLRILYLVSTIYHNPEEISKEVRALGLRHVKYSPPEALLPLMTNAILHTLGTELQGFWNEEIEGAWRNPFMYVQKTIARAMRTGTNLVTQCCKSNNLDEMQNVLISAPRGERAMWILETRAIGSTLSPFYWVMYEAKVALLLFMIRDLTAIRADREAYYCGIEELFTTHPGVIANLAIFVPDSLPVLLDGLLWVSRAYSDNTRRINYYVKHLFGNPGLPRFFDAYKTPIASLCDLHKVVVFGHPVVQFLVDTKWAMYGRALYIRAIVPYVVCMVMFVLGNAICVRADHSLIPEHKTAGLFFKYLTFIVATPMFVGVQCRRIYNEYRRNQVLHYRWGPIHIAIPYMLTKAFNITKFLLMFCVIIAFFSDPTLSDYHDSIFHREVLDKLAGNPENTHKLHAWMVAFASILFCGQIFDLFTLGNHAAKFKLQAVAILPELFPLIGILFIFLIAFSCSFSVTAVIWADQSAEVQANPVAYIRYRAFSSFELSLQNLFALGMSCFEYDWADLPPFGRFLFLIFAFINFFIVLNLGAGTAAGTLSMIAKDIDGLSLRDTATNVIEIETTMSLELRQKHYDSCKFEQRMEFDEGDLAIAGGIQIVANLTEHKFSTDKIDQIQRYSGEANPTLPWPRDQNSTGIGGEGDDVLRDAPIVQAVHQKIQRTHKTMYQLIKKIKVANRTSMVNIVSESMVESSSLSDSG